MHETATVSKICIQTDAVVETSVRCICVPEAPCITIIPSPVFRYCHLLVPFTEILHLKASPLVMAPPFLDVSKDFLLNFIYAYSVSHQMSMEWADKK